MKRFVRRTLAFCLALVFLTGTLALFPGLTASAADAGSLAGKETGTRFIFRSVTAEGITYNAENNLFTLSLYANPTFTANRVSPVSVSGGTNAVCITFVNRSASAEIALTYEYYLNSPQSKTVKKAILPNQTEEQTVILPLPEIDRATGLSFSFGVSEGTVELCSFFNISAYSNSFHDEIAVETCRFNEETGNVEISGAIGWETTVRYSDATLALFSLDPSEDAYLSNKTPIARTGISFSFSFSVSGSSAEDLYYRYVIAAVTATGERIPLTSPLYPTVYSGTPETSGDFKGIHTGDFENAISAGAQSAIVDVYLDKVLNTQNSGILYAGEHSYYYFNSDYVATIDTAVRNLTGAGCRTYLRFLISGDANGLSFVSYTESGEKVTSKGVFVKTQDALLTVYALTDFLSARYKDDTVGRISGLILGQNVNRATLYNRTDAKTLAEDAALYAAAFSLIFGVASRNVPGLTMVLPLSDNRVGKTLETAEMTGDYPADLYLYSFMEALKDTYLEPPAITLMIESFEVPAEVSLQKSEALDADHLGDLRVLLDRFSAEYGNLLPNVLYSWAPTAGMDAATAEGTYVILFLKLKAVGYVSGFFLNTAGLSATESAKKAESLSFVLRYIDTGSHEAVVAPVLERIGTTAANVVSGYTPANYIRQTLHGYTLTGTYREGVSITGRYTLWNFAATTNTQDFYSGSGCGDLSVLSGTSGNGLSARLTFGGSGFSGMAHRFVYAKNLSIAPYLRFEIGIDGKKNTVYELQIQLIGSTSFVTASAVVNAGEEGTYCLDLSDAAEAISDVQCLRICARPLNGGGEDCTLSLRSVTLESTQYNDDDLKYQITQSGNADNSNTDANRHDFTTPIIVTAAVILVSIALAVILFTRRKNHNNHSKETEER